jgi:hypothetical protein
MLYDAPLLFTKILIYCEILEFGKQFTLDQSQGSDHINPLIRY